MVRLSLTSCLAMRGSLEKPQALMREVYVRTSGAMPEALCSHPTTYSQQNVKLSEPQESDCIHG